MTVLQVADLKFGFGGDVLFEGVTMSLALGERAALVAPNGAGKSTFLRLVAREIEPDGGSVVVKRETTVAYYRQSHEVAAEGDRRRICGLSPTWLTLAAARPKSGKVLHYQQFVHPEGFESVSFAAAAFYG